MRMLPTPLDKSQLVTRLRPYRRVAANDLFDLLAQALSEPMPDQPREELAALSFEAGRKWGVMQAFDTLRKSNETKVDLAGLAIPGSLQ